jgi:hypothetical protein
MAEKLFLEDFHPKLERAVPKTRSGDRPLLLAAAELTAVNAKPIYTVIRRFAPAGTVHHFWRHFNEHSTSSYVWGGTSRDSCVVLDKRLGQKHGRNQTVLKMHGGPS